MKILDSSQTLQALAKALGKPCMHISWVLPDGASPLAVLRAAPYLKDMDQVLCEQSAHLVFDTEDEMAGAFNATAGDGSRGADGKTFYPVVYALTCGADGELQGENT